ncbi:DUF5672 family protein [Butyrivibrio proteoclasticus]|uniref:DUF5672 family protein n=1 Tax=Butyrivibrio proteoclasticus TaxID=43305 RepID=UPI00047D20EB|nr:DUF5672 family protein [Butyrivibrio proteoclasticus]
MKIKDNKLVIVIPMYKSILSSNDMLSLRSIDKNKGDCDVIIVAPEGLSVESVPFEKYCYEYYDKSFFRSADTYSKLLMDKSFYERFSKYSHILIIQLDALLLKKIDSNFDHYLKYDYIGAPWETPVCGYCCFFKGMSKIKKALKPKELCVGNGGFSLRNISACLALLEDHKYARKIWNTGEDVFFSYYGALEEYFLIPNKEIASSFAVENQIEVHIDSGDIPYGIHAFEKNARETIEELITISLMSN